MSGHFEGIKYAYRQSKDGVVVSFVIHPNDVPAELATAALGTVYMIGFSTVDEHDAALPSAEDVKGIMGEVDHGPRPVKSVSMAATIASSADVPASPAKTHRKWRTLPPSQRAALLCKEPEFWKWLTAIGFPVFDEHQANLDLKSMCEIESKTTLDTNNLALVSFNMLEGDYFVWRQARGHGATA